MAVFVIFVNAWTIFMFSTSTLRIEVGKFSCWFNFTLIALSRIQDLSHKFIFYASLACSISPSAKQRHYLCVCQPICLSVRPKRAHRVVYTHRQSAGVMRAVVFGIVWLRFCPVFLLQTANIWSSKPAQIFSDYFTYVPSWSEPIHLPLCADSTSALVTLNNETE